MSQLLLNPKKHIANRKAMEEFECCICYELAEDARLCKGPCAKSYCLKCIGRIKNIKDVCPSKCSQPFESQPIPSLKLQYHCPYNAQNCTFLLHSINDFQRHCQECKFITPQGEKQVLGKKYLLCQKGHKLELFTLSIQKDILENEQNFYTLVMNDLCFGCGGRNLCRSICVPCSSHQKRHVYCVDCRKFPFTKTKCPMGHNYLQDSTIGNYGSVCDHCGISGGLMGEKGYADYVCNVFMCEKCHQVAPEYIQMQQEQMALQMVEQHPSPSSSQ